MSNVPITSLPPATTPLTGTEVIPLVQGPSTKKATVADIAAGVNVNSILPAQAGQDGKVLGTDGSVVSWVLGGGGSDSNAIAAARVQVGGGTVGPTYNLASADSIGVGKVQLNFTPGFFSNLPVVICVAGFSASNGYSFAVVDQPDNDTAIVWIRNNLGVLEDASFDFIAVQPGAGGGGGSPSGVQWLTAIGDISDSGGSGELQILLIPGYPANIGDGVVVEFNGIAQNSGAGVITLGFDVNGSLSGQVAFNPASGIAAFNVRLFFRKIAADALSYTGFVIVGLDQSVGPVSTDPAHSTHQSTYQDGCPYAGTLDLKLTWSWSTPSVPTIEVVGGYAQLMVTPPLFTPA